MQAKRLRGAEESNLNVQRSNLPFESICFILVVTSTFLYLQLFILPHTTIFGGGGDESYYLLCAQRMTDGQIIYRDFFSEQPAGTSLLYAAIIDIFGNQVWIPNLMLVLIGTSLVALIIYISAQLISGFTAVLPGLLYLCFGLKSWLDATHHWYSALLVLAAIAVLIDSRTTLRVALAGALCGLAASFTSAHGGMGLVGLAAYLAWEHRFCKDLPRAEAYLVGGFGLGWLLLNGWIIYAAGPRTFFYSTAVFQVLYLRSYPPNSFWTLFWLNPIRTTLDFSYLGRWLFIGLLVPWIYIWCLFQLRLRYPWNKTAERNALSLLAIMGLVEFIAVLPAARFERVVVVSFPAFIILVHMIQTKRYPVFQRALWIVALFLLIAWSLRTQCRAHWLVKMRSNTVAVWDSRDAARFQWLNRNTRAGERIFDSGDGEVYFWLDVKNPTKVPFVTASDFTRPEQIRKVVDDLERQQVRIVLWNSLIYGSNYCQPAHDHTSPLREYLCDHYQIVRVDGDESILERSTPLNPEAKSACLERLGRHWAE